jgi:DNA-binding NarL/FixJ family response regulator
MTNRRVRRLVPVQVDAVQHPRRRRPPCPSVVRLANGGIAIQGGGSVTPRQLRVMDCVAAGLMNTEVATVLDMTTSATAREIRALLTATGVPNRIALAAWWVEVRLRYNIASHDPELAGLSR